MGTVVAIIELASLLFGVIAYPGAFYWIAEKRNRGRVPAALIGGMMGFFYPGLLLSMQLGVYPYGTPLFDLLTSFPGYSIWVGGAMVSFVIAFFVRPNPQSKATQGVTLPMPLPPEQKADKP